MNQSNQPQEKPDSDDFRKGLRVPIPPPLDDQPKPPPEE